MHLGDLRVSSNASTEASSSGPRPADPHEAFARSLVGMRIGGRYVVDSVLGKGGMGLVVSAHYADLEQKVAIKVMFPEHAASATHAKRFLREAKVAAKLRSPNLVRVTDIGNLESGIPYLVMELLAGHDLDRELATRGALPVEDAVAYVLEAATGLAELHALGIVHRDLKPGNLFLAETASGREIKILDYGISKEATLSGSSLTMTDTLIGTPSHMSPEQIKTPKEVDTRSDIWSLGVILYELLAYKLPFDLEGSTVGELFGLVLFSDPVPLRVRRPELPEALEAIVMKCLRRDRNDRWSTVAELAEALAPFARPEHAHRVAAIAKVMAKAPALPTPSSPAIPVARAADRDKATVVSGPARVEQVGGVITPQGGVPITSPSELVARTAVASSDEHAAISKSLATDDATPAGLAPSGAGRKTLAVVVGAVALVAAGGLALVLRSSAPPSSGLVPSTVDPPMASEVPSAAPAPPSVSAPPSAVPPTVLTPIASAPSAPSSAPAPASAPVKGRPAASAAPKGTLVRTFPTDPPRAPAPRASAAPAPGSGELILDRK